MSINLSVSFSHPEAIGTRVSYARIDNTASPVFTTLPNLVGASGVFSIAQNIPAGQYQINAVPIYADGRTCNATIKVTPACAGLTSISASISGSTLIIQYLAPSSVPKVRVTVNYPNGGSYVANYVNNGNSIAISLPAGVYGNYSIFGQSVCDEASGFYSVPSSSVNVSYNTVISGSFRLSNTALGTCNATPATVYTTGSFVTGSQLFLDAGLTSPVTGYAYGQMGTIIYNLNSINGTLGADSGQSCSSPSFTQISVTDNGTQTQQVAQIGPSVTAGNKYTATVYSHTVTYIAVSGDTPNSVAVGIRNAINATIESQWNDHGSAPAHGTTGFPPTASTSGNNVTIVLNSGNSFVFNSSVS